MLHVARALIFNPEMLVFHKLLDEADSDDIELMSTILREFVDHRGVEMPEALIHRRRPRTCFFTGGQHLGSKMCYEVADEVWELSDEKGLQEMKGGGGNVHHLSKIHWTSADASNETKRVDAGRALHTAEHAMSNFHVYGGISSEHPLAEDTQPLPSPSTEHLQPQVSSRESSPSGRPPWEQADAVREADRYPSICSGKRCCY